MISPPKSTHERPEPTANVAATIPREGYMMRRRPPWARPTLRVAADCQPPCLFDDLDRSCVGGPSAGAPCAADDGCPGGFCSFNNGVCAGGDNSAAPCTRDADCPGSASVSGAECNVTGCDDVQVVPLGTRGLQGRSVVVAAGSDGVLDSTPFRDDVAITRGNLRADTTAALQDPQVALPTETVVAGQSIVKPGFDGFLDTIPTGDDVSFIGTAFKITNPLGPDSDFDQVRDGIERLLGSDPTDPRDAGNFADRDQDGLTDSRHMANIDLTIAKSRTIALEKGQGFVVHGVLGDLEGDPDHGCQRGCTMNFLADFDFASLQSGGFQVRSFAVRGPASDGSSEQCAATVHVQIQVN